MIASAYMPELAGCELRRVLGTSMVAKHCVGLVCVYFSVVLIKPDITSEGNVPKMLLMTVALYAWFVLTTRCAVPDILMILVVVFAAYLMEQQRDAVDARRRKTLDRVVLTLVCAALGMTALGVLAYLLRKKREFGDDFSYYYFLVGRMRCASMAPGSTELLEPM